MTKRHEEKKSLTIIQRHLVGLRPALGQHRRVVNPRVHRRGEDAGLLEREVLDDLDLGQLGRVVRRHALGHGRRECHRAARQGEHGGVLRGRGGEEGLDGEEGAFDVGLEVELDSVTVGSVCRSVCTLNPAGIEREVGWKRRRSRDPAGSPSPSALARGEWRSSEAAT